MKRATALLSAIALIFISFTSVFAQVQIEKPVLPEDFLYWPYHTVNSCQDFQENLWGKIDKEKETLEFVSLMEIDGRDVSFEYTGGDASKPKFSIVFLKQNDEWVKFDGMKQSQYDQYLTSLATELAKNDTEKNSYSDDCAQRLDDGLKNFIDKLLSALKSKN